MESLGYLLIYFLRGRLPWQELEREANANMILLERKKNIGLDELCDQAPPEFASFMEHVRGLTFKDKPNYSQLRSMFRRLFTRSGYEYDNVFDWTVKHYIEIHGI